MKNIIKWGFICVIGMACFLLKENLFAQSKWVVQFIHLQAPTMTHYHQYLSGKPNDFDTVYDKKDSIPSFDDGSLAQGDILEEYSVKDDSIYILYGDSRLSIPNEPDLISIRFLLDTLTKRLINFTYGFSRVSQWSVYLFNGHENFVFDSIDYKISGDTIIVRDTGKITRENFVNLSYQYHETTHSGSKTNSIFEYWLDSVRLQDTASFIFDLTLILTKPIDIVGEKNLLLKTLDVSTTLPDHSIHFSFPTSDHAQRMMIYDILGREVSRVEIPAGSSSYVMSSTGFAKGTFFTRLGSSGAKFIVY